MNKYLLFIAISISLYSEDISFLSEDVLITNKLIILIKNNDVKGFKDSINKYDNAYIENKNQETLLFEAVRFQNTEIVSFLIGYGLAIGSINRYGQTVLHIAVKNNFADIVEILMRNGAVDSLDNSGYSVHEYGYRYNSLESLEMMRIYKKTKKIKKQDRLDRFINDFRKKSINEM